MIRGGGLTLPGFATSEHTKDNAHKLMRALGVTAAELDITPTARWLPDQARTNLTPIVLRE